jgi:hypothetical protein
MMMININLLNEVEQIRINYVLIFLPKDGCISNGDSDSDSDSDSYDEYNLFNKVGPFMP